MRPVAAYIGGKKNLARRLCSRIEAVPHKIYAEPFVGMGGVFLRRHSAPPAEYINDLSRDVATFYRVLQEHPQAFLDLLRWQLASRAEFDRLMAVDPDTLTDLRRAARFLYLQRCAYGGKVRGCNFAMDLYRGSRFNPAKIAPLLQDLHDRLQGVVIEQLAWQAFLVRYDTADTLFYLDPPYFGSEDDYGAELFDQGQFVHLADRLAGLKGRFILSINATPETREIFGRFDLEEVGTHYGISSGRQSARELIVSN